MTGDLIIYQGVVRLYQGFAEDFEFEVTEAGFVDIKFHLEGRVHLYGGMHVGWIFIEAEIPESGKAS